MRHRFWLLILLIWMLVVPAGAQEAEARLLACMVECSAEQAAEILFDGDEYAPFSMPEGTCITLTAPEGIGSLYLIFDSVYGSYTITDNDTGASATWGEQGFLHDFVDLEDLFSHTPKSVTLTFEMGDVQLNEIMPFSGGEVPDFVQKWEWPQDERADLVLFSAHSDDEQLFFAGVIPYYAAELNYRVQVVYMTDHKNLYSWRVHEALDGLWNVGLRRYPVFGPFGDHYCRSREEAYARYLEDGVTEQDLTAFAAEQLRRFRPLVVLSHDINGEYSHGQHMTCADAVMAASEVSAVQTAFPESSDQYGVWDVPKVYLHLYELNPIHVNWDRPLSRFDGMTAYHVTKDLGFPSHVSQTDGFDWYMSRYDTAEEIEYYNPCDYGLYRSIVGPDVQKDDFFENLSCYAEQDRLAQEAADRETERLAAEKKAQEAARQQSRSEPLSERPEQSGREPALIPAAAAVSLLLTGGILIALLRRRKNYFLK